MTKSVLVQVGLQYMSFQHYLREPFLTSIFYVLFLYLPILGWGQLSWAGAQISSFLFLFFSIFLLKNYRSHFSLIAIEYSIKIPKPNFTPTFFWVQFLLLFVEDYLCSHHSTATITQKNNSIMENLYFLKNI